MGERIIEIEAVSLEDAVGLLNKDDIVALQVTVLCYGETQTIEKVADTVEEAIVNLKKEIPEKAQIVVQEVKVTPERFSLKKKAESDIKTDKVTIIESMVLCKKARKGFWGFFKRPNLYNAEIFRRAVVEITFREKAKIKATICDYSAEDLLQNIHKLLEKKAQWTEVIQALNPKNDSAIRDFMVELQTKYPSDLASVLHFVENECRKHPKDDWKRTIREAHWRALMARVKNKTSLRQLDVDIAGEYAFFTSIDWYAKHYEKKKTEPTGLPRDFYGGHHFTDKKLGVTIPHYSTDEKDFDLLERRIKGFGLYELYLQFLAGEEKSETTTLLEQKCNAALKTIREKPAKRN